MHLKSEKVHNLNKYSSKSEVNGKKSVMHFLPLAAPILQKKWELLNECMNLADKSYVREIKEFQ